MPVTTPVITSNGGADTATVTINEGVSTATTVVASDLDGDALTYSLIGGVDRFKFKIDAATGVLTFIAPADFEKPVDTSLNGTNTYQVQVKVSDGDLFDTQMISVNIANVNPVTLNGTTADNIIGPTGTTVDGDTLNGLAGNDTLDGGLGADTMNGGLGNDTFIVDNTADLAVEALNEGTDLVKASVTYTLGVNVENLILTGTTAINGTGNTLINTLTGNVAANILDGGTGADIMAGGVGNDTYVVDDAGDAVTELDGEGTDLVKSGVTYTLGNYLENLTLTGSSAINGKGNGLNNVITGNGAANTLTGNGGNDTLDGGVGVDTLIGNAGNDTYYVDSTSDVVTETLSQGTDIVKATATFTLSANVENLTLTGSTGISGTGNELNNVITGNSGVNTLTGLAGNDTLNGGTGADTMVGGLGDDKYYVDNAADTVTEASNEGTDTVSSTINYSIASLGNIENITLTGLAVSATGNALNNILIGNNYANSLSGGDGNDTLNGMGGIDTMIGGKGNDTYVLNTAGEVVTEASGEGTDTVESSVTHTLGANVENLTLTYLSAINGTGNTLDNIITGNTAANTLTGLDGNDTLNGGRGNDTMVGGIGNDTYYVGEVGDVVTEVASQGTDAVISTLSSYTLAAEVENLTLNGTSDIAGTGNSVANVITGNSGWNNLNGGGGNDTILGGAGADTITGGAGYDTLTGGTDIDTFVFSALTDSGLVAGSRDNITDFQAGEIINLVGIDANSTLATDQAFVLGTDATWVAGELQLTQSGSVVTVSLYTDSVAGADMTFTVTLGVDISALTVDNFIL